MPRCHIYRQNDPPDLYREEDRTPAGLHVHGQQTPTRLHPLNQAGREENYEAQQEGGE